MMKIKHLLLFVCLLVASSLKSQSPFKSGNIVVVRLGTGGVTSYGGQTAPTFLDEYTPAGSLVQSIALPIVDNGANFRITFNYNRGNQGLLTSSPDKQYLTLAGWKASPASPLSGLNTTSTDRIIARIDYNGAINTSTSILGTDLGDGPSPIAAITNDGSSFWVMHDGVTGGIHYSVLGQSTVSPIVVAPNIRTANIENGQLYCTASSLPSIVSGGLPTSGPQTVTSLPGFSAPGTGNSTQFFFADLNPSIPGYDVIYLAESNTIALTKYSFDQNTGSWVSNGTIGTTSDDYRGITGVVNGTSVILYCTRKVLDNSSSNAGELVTITDNTGYNPGPNTFVGTPAILKMADPNTSFRGVAMVPQPLSVSLSTKAFLQAAYNTGLGRHKDVTLTWAGILNANALNQPYSGAPWNYAGTESVTNGFFSSTGGTTDILDWVLVELHDATNPSTIIARKACFIREDGKIVDLDGTSDPSFTGVGANNYYIVIKHRNHLTLRSSTTVFVNGATPVLYDFTTAQSQAYQNGAIVTNPAMKDLTGGGTVFGMWGGNANSNTSTRASGALSTNDYLYLVNILLGGNTATILNTYSPGDLNLDGQVRASGALTTNDYLILVNIILGGNTANIYTEHQ
jgi:hypothetical protein